MLKIRLTRLGSKKNPFYRIVVSEAKNARDGRYLEDIGIYDPTKEPCVLKVNSEQAKKWLGNGAQPTEVVTRLFKTAGVL
ncbi:30S ribosomal protein S16 [Clostridia bacterium]|nr:30S ribosomal protein S16 [Clostridia bacterium]GHU78373.1 30S ribosomal protein S16 [Clostridia bacterium]